MRLLNRGLFLILLQFLFFMGKDAFGQVTTVGKEFWVGFMDNNNSQGPDAAIIVISANEESRGIIDLSGVVPGRTESFDLAAGQNFTLRLPSANGDFLHRNSGIIEKKGIFIQSDGDISVYAFNERARSADGTVILPIPTLGKDYWITSHFETLPDIENYPPDYRDINANNESLMLIVGVEDNTEVEIVPSVNTEDGKSSGVPFRISLSQGESYQLMARGDLTGSRVTVVGSDVLDCKNIAVFGGNKWTGVGQCGFANDHLFQQMYPTNTWGNEFIHVPLATRTSGEMVKILASENDTEVFLDGNLTDLLNSGDFKTYDFNSLDVRVIQSSKPVAVSVFSKSQECNDSSRDGFFQGDPFMILYSPNQQMLRNVTFEAMNVVEIQNNNFVTILVNTSSKNNTRLDGANIGGTFSEVPGNRDYSYAVVPVVSGSHSLSNPEGFIAYVYGFGYLESYGYAVGTSLENLNFEVDEKYDFEVIGDKVACLDKEGTWSIKPENDLFQYFIWDFGDGTETKVGSELSHIYEEPGKYTVKITASISENSCDSQEDILFDVEVLESEGKIEGIDRVCPDVEEHWYDMADLQNVSRIEWFADGGEIVNEENFRVLVRWGGANEQAKLTGTPIGINGCPGGPIEFNVRINQKIEPEIPTGETEICFDPTLNHEYEVDLILDNRAYEWFIYGGEIIAAKEQPKVVVNWNQPGINGKIWYREFSINDELCEGLSDTLTVNVFPELSIETKKIQNVLCFGQENGEIVVEALGGRPPFIFKWSHDPSLNSSIAGGLGPGNYQVLVTDALGCEISSESITITEPSLLNAELFHIQGTSCFGREDGEAQIRISGGTQPYRTAHTRADLNGTELRLAGLAKGIENLVIFDAQDCEVTLSFEIVSPLPLEADVRLLKPSCPGESNGELIVTPIGGVSPYQFTWDYQNNDGQLLSGAPKGTYTATVVDSRNCISFGSGEITEEAPMVRLPTGFRPEDGGINAIFQGVSNCNLVFKLNIYNRWGELIYHGTQGWDGTVNQSEAPPGTYTYLMEYSYFLEGENWVKEIRGTFMLLR